MTGDRSAAAPGASGRPGWLTGPATRAAAWRSYTTGTCRAYPTGTGKLPAMSRVGLGPEDWPILRDLRLSALLESPDCFLSAYDRECHFGRKRWLAEFSRGDWHIALSDGQPAGLIGVTRKPGDPASQCYLEYLWVVPQARGTGFALSFLLDVLGQLHAAGVRTVLLWVMDGNLPAARLYEKAGFESVGQPVPLAARPGRSEQLFRLEFAAPAPALAPAMTTAR